MSENIYEKINILKNKIIKEYRKQSADLEIKQSEHDYQYLKGKENAFRLVLQWMKDANICEVVL